MSERLTLRLNALLLAAVVAVPAFGIGAAVVVHQDATALLAPAAEARR